MNEAEFRAEQLKSKHALQEGVIDSKSVITGMRLEDGSYHVLSRYSDDTWILPDTLFYSGMSDSRKKLKFSRVPIPFRETLMTCMANYILSGIEGRPNPKPALFMSMLIERREAPGCWHRLPAAVFAV